MIVHAERDFFFLAKPLQHDGEMSANTPTKQSETVSGDFFVDSSVCVKQRDHFFLNNKQATSKQQAAAGLTAAAADDDDDDDKSSLQREAENEMETNVCVTLFSDVEKSHCPGEQYTFTTTSVRHVKLSHTKMNVCLCEMKDEVRGDGRSVCGKRERENTNTQPGSAGKSSFFCCRSKKKFPSPSSCAVCTTDRESFLHAKQSNCHHHAQCGG